MQHRGNCWNIWVSGFVQNRVKNINKCWIHSHAAWLYWWPSDTSQSNQWTLNLKYSISLFFYSHTGPARPLWLRILKLPESSLRLRARRAAFHLAVKRSRIFTASSLWYPTWMMRYWVLWAWSDPHRSPASYLSSINIVDEVQRLLEGLAHVKLQLLDGPHILHPELGACVRRAVTCGGRTSSNQLEKRRVEGRGGRGGKRDWPKLLVESVSRLATVLDLESPPKLESTDYMESETWEGVGYIQRGRRESGSVVTFACVCVCVAVLCFWCWSRCSASCCCCGAFWLSGTSFTMTTTSSPPALPTWTITDHSVKHLAGPPPQVSTETRNNWM